MALAVAVGDDDGGAGASLAGGRLVAAPRLHRRVLGPDLLQRGHPAEAHRQRADCAGKRGDGDRAGTNPTSRPVPAAGDTRIPPGSHRIPRGGGLRATRPRLTEEGRALGAVGWRLRGVGVEAGGGRLQAAEVGVDVVGTGVVEDGAGGAAEERGEVAEAAQGEVGDEGELAAHQQGQRARPLQQPPQHGGDGDGPAPGRGLHRAASPEPPFTGPGLCRTFTGPVPGPSPGRGPGTFLRRTGPSPGSLPRAFLRRVFAGPGPGASLCRAGAFTGPPPGPGPCLCGGRASWRGRCGSRGSGPGAPGRAPVALKPPPPPVGAAAAGLSPSRPPPSRSGAGGADVARP